MLAFALRIYQYQVPVELYHGTIEQTMYLGRRTTVHCTVGAGCCARKSQCTGVRLLVPRGRRAVTCSTARGQNVQAWNIAMGTAHSIRQMDGQIKAAALQGDQQSDEGCQCYDSKDYGSAAQCFGQAKKHYAEADRLARVMAFRRLPISPSLVATLAGTDSRPPLAYKYVDVHLNLAIAQIKLYKLHDARNSARAARELLRLKQEMPKDLREKLWVNLILLGPKLQDLQRADVPSKQPSSSAVTDNRVHASRGDAAADAATALVAQPEAAMMAATLAERQMLITTAIAASTLATATSVVTNLVTTKAPTIEPTVIATAVVAATVLAAALLTAATHATKEAAKRAATAEREQARLAAELAAERQKREVAERVPAAERELSVCQLAVLACSPEIMPLPNVLHEAREVSLSLPASVIYNAGLNELAELLTRRRTRRVLFSMHTDAPFGSGLTLGATTPDGSLASPPPQAVVQTLGRHTPRHGGLLDLVFYNGCRSQRQAMKTLLTGVEYVIYWPTRSETTACLFLSKKFFAAVANNCRYEWAFENACDALISEPAPRSPAVPIAAVPMAVPMRWEMRDPDAPGGPPANRYPHAAGIPCMLRGGDRPAVARLLLWAAMSPRVALHRWLCRARDSLRVRQELVMMLARHLNRDLARLIMRAAYTL